ncbi:MAG TPA: IS4 family transposase [Terriglobales bacterium]|nr:IS4 family transposase [Terriglobales bacterium]
MIYVLGMTSPDYASILGLYQRTLSTGVLEYLQRQAGMRIRRGIYAAQVVLWLMIVQRLQPVGTLASAIQLLLQGIAAPVLPNCKRVAESRISSRTGGYCRARQRLPQVLCRQVMREILLQLRQVLSGAEVGQRPVFLLDGSSLELEHCKELVRAYPPAQNQYGRSHWPVVRMLVLHDVESGLAEEPSWGPMYGPHAVSEQELAEKAMEKLPANAVVLGDRNFGIFWIAYAAQQRGLGVVLRLTDVRAGRLVETGAQAGEQRVGWQPSRWDGGNHHHWPPEAMVEGRVIWFRMGRGKSQEWLYLFTTLDWSAHEIIELYGRRWNIETDLRSLKRTVRLHHIAAKSEEMMEKELLIAVAAYNLVRAVMCLAARRNNLDPRQLSFAHVLNVVNAAWPKLAAAQTHEEHHRHFEQVLVFAAQCRLPKRSKRRSYPRAVWRRSVSFPFSKEEKSK